MSRFSGLCPSSEKGAHSQKQLRQRILKQLSSEDQTVMIKTGSRCSTHRRQRCSWKIKLINPINVSGNSTAAKSRSKKEMIHRIISKSKWFLTIIHRSGSQANKTRRRQGQAEKRGNYRGRAETGRSRTSRVNLEKSVKALSFWANASRNHEPQWVDIIITAQTTKQWKQRDTCHFR